MKLNVFSSFCGPLIVFGCLVWIRIVPVPVGNPNQRAIGSGWIPYYHFKYKYCKFVHIGFLQTKHAPLNNYDYWVVEVYLTIYVWWVYVMKSDTAVRWPAQTSNQWEPWRKAAVESNH